MSVQYSRALGSMPEPRRAPFKDGAQIVISSSGYFCIPVISRPMVILDLRHVGTHDCGYGMTSISKDTLP